MIQYDHLLAFASESAALNDAALSAWRGGADWDRSCVCTGLKIYDERNDVSGAPDADGNAPVTHTYLTNFWIAISLDHVDAALAAHPRIRVIAQHVINYSVEQRPTADWVVQSTIPIPQLRFYHLSPS